MPREISEFEEKVIQVDRVTRVVKGGKRMRFRAIVTIGNEKGKVGIGVGKAGEVAAAVQKAVAAAKKTMIELTIVNETIPHEEIGKFGSALVLLKPASKGTGIIAGGAVRSVIEVSGIKNILSKSYGSSNRMNTARATFIALSSLKTRDARMQELGVLKLVEKKESPEEEDNKDIKGRK